MPMQPPIATAPKYVKTRSFDKADTFNQKAMDIAKKKEWKKSRFAETIKWKYSQNGYYWKS